MKEDKLQSLYYYFINKRDRMKPDRSFLNSTGNFSDYDGMFLPQMGVSVVDGVAQGFDALPVAQCANQQPVYNDLVAEAGIVESNEITLIGSNLLQIADEFSSSNPTRSIIQFEKHCIVVPPEEQIISVAVVRSDKDVGKERKFTWETCDKSALADIHYVASSGELTFEVNETKKMIPIKILTNDIKASNLRFIVKLTDTYGVFNPALLTINLKEVDDLYADEIPVMNNLAKLQPSSAMGIKSILSDHLNQRTFYMGLSFLCSTTDTLNVQFALALELAHICRPKLQDDVILDALNNFFAQDDIQP